MMQLVNQSRFQAFALPVVCHQDSNHLLVVVKGTFDIGGGGQEVSISQRQIEVYLADKYWGEPGVSSLKYEAEIAPTKPGTDVILIGKAWSSNGSVQQLDVSLKAGPLSKVLRVFGDRYWEKTSTGWNMTPPVPFESMPLVYEYAYGGKSPAPENDESSDFDTRNPVGKGYVSKKIPATLKRIPLPNIELPDQLISKIKHQPTPAGFGAIARNWQPRSSLLGTYDKQWEDNRNPLLPTDFDPASYSAASAGLCASGYFEGGEQITIDNMSAHGQVNFTLPKIGIKAVSYINEQRNEHDLNLDTIVIETERSKLSVTWRVAIPCHWNVAMVEWIKVLEAS